MIARRTIPLAFILGILAFAAQAAAVRAQVRPDSPVDPAAVVDLATGAGAALVDGVWKYSDAQIVKTSFRKPGADRTPSGPSDTTYELRPRANAAGFDDSSWQRIAPETLDQRRGPGKTSFNWYRLSFTIPQRVGSIDPTGYDVVFEIVIDDYSEVWTDGDRGPVLGQSGGNAIAGYNAPNRVLVAHNAKPGLRIQLAVLGANGPLSSSPENYIWVRSATLDFYKPNQTEQIATETRGHIERSDPALRTIVPEDVKIENVATGFQFTEGPVWVRDGGYLLFSDPNANKIYRWTPDGELSVYRTKSGYAGTDIGEYTQPGSNGLTLDQQGRLTIDEMGNRRVTRLEKNGVLTVLADGYQGKRFNSPNDLVYRSDGALYFTDPPFGLPKMFADARKELPYSGVFCLINGTVKLVSTDLRGPNGLAFSPDEKYLYVGNWADDSKIVKRYEVHRDGTLSHGALFCDLTKAPGEDAIDGMKVDRAGNLYVSGPGGIWIFSPNGKHLGTIVLPEHPHNLAWGDADGKTLYLAARSSIYRIRLNVAGTAP